MKKYVALLLAPMFAFVMVAGCTPTQVNTANIVYSKITFYSGLARSMISVAEANYKDNEKVASALEATRASLLTLETLVASIEAGTNKDESKLAVALGSLVGAVFNLIAAINAAKSVPKTTVTT
jgi:hypothetical protein